jgi:chorismate-pyruvate lyase
MRRRPLWTIWQMIQLPFAIARVKARIQGGARIDVGSLPVNEDVLAYCRRARAAGRQVWLVCAGETLAWAESWWNIHQAEIHLRDRRQPIWTSLTAGRAELFREVDGLGQVEAEWLTQRFGLAGPYWSRHYRFFRAGRELTVIREVFSPALQRWLGDPVVCASEPPSND